MIVPPADIQRALAEGTGRRKIRVRWVLADGSSPGIDISDRVTNISSISRTIAPMLGGAATSSLTLSVENTDRAFSPSRAAPATSAFAALSKQDYLGGKITYEEGIEGDASGWHYMPQYVGVVRDVDWTDGSLEVSIDDLYASLVAWPMPQDYEIDTSNTASDSIQDIISTFTSFTSSDIDSTSFGFADNVQADIDWLTFGLVSKEETIGKAVDDLARSGLGVVYADESGLIKYDTEFPVTSGGRTRTIDSAPFVFDKTNAGGWTIGESRTAVVTEVNVSYQGVGWPYREPSLEDSIGRNVATVDMPYLFRGANAAHAARILYEVASDFIEAVQFATNEIGWMVQVNDRLPIRDPITNDLETVRVLQKSQPSRGVVQIAAVKEHHESTYTNETFLKEGDSWTSSSLRWF